MVQQSSTNNPGGSHSTSNYIGAGVISFLIILVLLLFLYISTGRTTTSEKSPYNTTELRSRTK
jgi:hypothetical protein